LGFLITLISYSNYFNLIEFDLLLGFPGLSDNFFIYFNLCYVYSLIFYVIYNKRAFIFTFLDKFRLIVYIIQTYPVTSIKFLIYVLFFYYRIQNDISIDNILLMNSGGGGSGSGLPPHNGGNNPLPPGGGNNPLPPEGERLRILPANNPINTSASLDLIKTKVQ